MADEKSASQKVPLAQVKSNIILDIGTDGSEAQKLGKLTERWGNFIQILGWKKDGFYINVDGQAKLNALKNSDFKSVNITVMPFKTEDEAIMFTLLWSSVNKELNNINTSMLIKQLLEHGITRKQIMEELGVSKSWLSKKECLANNLNENIVQLVINNSLHPSKAEAIARLPKDEQVDFSNKASDKRITKANIEKLVSTYNNNNTPDIVKLKILNNPEDAIDEINKNNSRKIRNKTQKNTLESFIKASRYLINQINEILQIIDVMNNEDVEICKNYSEDLSDQIKILISNLN
jgi:transcriptional regulator with XRE-family HTH domain